MLDMRRRAHVHPCITHSRNLGLGVALRTGFVAADTAWVGWLCAHGVPGAAGPPPARGVFRPLRQARRSPAAVGVPWRALGRPDERLVGSADAPPPSNP
jgi:hypothetical protein